MRLVVFCEARADFEIARDLVDRTLRDVGDPWVGDVMDVAPEGIRTYVSDEDGRSFFDVHHLRHYVRTLGTRVPHGHFDGRPGAADAVMARTMLAVVRTLAGPTVDAVIIVRDLDNDSSRRVGLEQARSEARAWATFSVVIGCPNIMREAWVLVGFEPESTDEEDRLAELRRELGFSPTEHAHRLDSNDEQAKHSPKRVLRRLTGGAWEREARCWQLASLERLRTRCLDCGLPDFLAEIAASLAPLCRK